MADGNIATNRDVATGSADATQSATAATAAPGPVNAADGWIVAEPTSGGFGPAPGGPASIGPTTGAGGRRGRGRPRKSEQPASGPTTQAKTALPIDQAKLAATLQFVHACAGVITKLPELTIDEQEAQTLAKPLADLQALYQVDVSEKAMAWGHMLAACGMVYGPRIVALQDRLRKKATPAPQAAAPIITPEPDQSPGSVHRFNRPVDLANAR